MILQQKLLNISVYISIFLQIVTGLVTGVAVFYKVPKEHMILKDINRTELIVQAVELIFYLYISIAVLRLSNVTPRRYFDWFISTPAMLFSTIMFFVYLKLLQNKQDTSHVRINTVFKNEKENIIRIVILNAGMLTFGLMGELGLIPLIMSNIAGFICFAGLFKILYNYAKDTTEGMKIYLAFLIIWGLYGVAQLFPELQKNLMYNILDLFAKNFYGIYIFYKLYQVKI